MALPELKKQWGGHAAVGSEGQRLHIKATFYTGKGSVPDLDGCMVGIGDLLQRAGVVSNDRWISSWDGSRIVEWREHNEEPHTVVVVSEYTG